MKRAQSALEYLTTYGWAILLIAVVIGILFKLGLFAANTFSARAPPGSCYISKPYGPNTTQMLALQGLCTGALPQYVETFGYNAFGNVPNNIIVPTNMLTLTGWGLLTYNNQGGSREDMISIKGGGPCGMILGYNTSGNTIMADIELSPVANVLTGTNGAIKLNQWYFYAATYNGVVLNLYVNGQNVGALAKSGNFAQCNAPTYIGSGTPSESSGVQYYWYGDLADVQAYGTALTPQEVQELYIGGIGASPTALTSLIGWWPLNGNMRDYSGDGLNAQTGGQNTIYQQSWASAYTPP